MDESTDSGKHANPHPLRIGISACLLGERVRYDGGHKHDRYLTDTLGRYFEWRPVCPEIELGLGTPREAMRLEKSGSGVSLMMINSRTDLSASMRAYAAARVDKLAEEDLCGYILKSDSPSCGMEKVRVYGAGSMPSRNGRGLFAAALLERFPHLPVEEEGRLCDPALRENWIERVFAYRDLRNFWRNRWTLSALMEFHARRKLAVLAHSPSAYKSLGQLVARAHTLSRKDLSNSYRADFMNALAIPATRGRHANVLQHMAGCFKRQLDDDSRRELAGLIEDYQRGELPLIVPVTLIRHYVWIFKSSYLAAQTYLYPHSKELALRNHV